MNIKKRPKENYIGHRVTEIYCVVSIDEDGDEGVPVVDFGGIGGYGQLPMFTTVRDFAMLLARHAKVAVVKGELYKFKVLKFTAAEEIDPE